MTRPRQNAFTDGALGAIYLRTALPVIAVMAMNGLMSVTDAIFLGLYVGPDALAAVTLMFPVYMLIVALSTLVGTGLSSRLARALGAGDIEGARAVYAGAHGLALTLALLLIVLFLLVGRPVALLAAAGSEGLAAMGHLYLQITVLFSPLMFVLRVNSDGLRNEARVGFMTATGLIMSLANIGFNYVLIARLDMGVAGSAYGTAAAQALAFAIIAAFRTLGDTPLRPATLVTYPLRAGWRRILALGAPQSLNFIGLAFGSAAVITMLQWVGEPGYADTVSAYGIITRVVTFAVLPLLGLSSAMQAVTGNNHGAALWHRTDASLGMALWAALGYCVLVQIVLMGLPDGIARAFVDDTAVIAEVGRILPIMASTFFLVGPLMIIAAHFQAIGSAGKAAVLGLTKPYAFAIPLTVLLPLWLGEIGIWLAGPIAETMLLGLTVLVLWSASRKTALKWGVFHGPTRGAR